MTRLPLKYNLHQTVRKNLQSFATINRDLRSGCAREDEVLRISSSSVQYFRSVRPCSDRPGNEKFQIADRIERFDYGESKRGPIIAKGRQPLGISPLRSLTRRGEVRGSGTFRWKKRGE